MPRHPFLVALLFVCSILQCGIAAAQQSQQRACLPSDLDDARHIFHRTWFEAADGRFSAYLEKCPDQPIAQAYLAVIDMLLYRDNSDRISGALQSAAALDRADARLVGAITSFAAGKLEDAERDLRHFLEAEPDDNYAAHFLGFTLNDLGRHHEGVASLRGLLERNPDYFPAKNHLAYGLLELGDSEAALRIAREFVADDPGNPSAWDTQAYILHALGRSEEAIASLSRSIVLDERFAYGFRHMGKILESAGNTDAARSAYTRALDSAGLYGPEFNRSVEKLIAALDED